MADDADDKIDLGGDDDAGDTGSKKKGAGLGALLPNLLKFVAIGLGMIILIVTISVITFNILNRGGQSQAVVSDDSSAYVGNRPEYSKFTALPVIRTTTQDPIPYSVVVEIVLGYDLNNATAATELTSRLTELQDFLRHYFSSTYNTDLLPEKEEQLKRDLMEKLNRLLNTAKIRAIYFTQLSSMEM